MSDILFVLWIISGSVLGIALSIYSKNTVSGMIFGFLLAPLLPIALVMAAVEMYSENRTAPK